LKSKRQRYASDATNATNGEKADARDKLNEVKLELPLISFEKGFNYGCDSIDGNYFASYDKFYSSINVNSKEMGDSYAEE